MPYRLLKELDPDKLSSRWRQIAPTPFFLVAIGLLRYFSRIAQCTPAFR